MWKLFGVWSLQRSWVCKKWWWVNIFWQTCFLSTWSRIPIFGTAHVTFLRSPYSEPITYNFCVQVPCRNDGQLAWLRVVGLPYLWMSIPNRCLNLSSLMLQHLTWTGTFLWSDILHTWLQLHFLSALEWVLGMPIPRCDSFVTTLLQVQAPKVWNLWWMPLLYCQRLPTHEKEPIDPWWGIHWMCLPLSLAACAMNFTMILFFDPRAK